MESRMAIILNYLQSAEKNPLLIKTGTGGNKIAITTKNQSFACIFILALIEF